MRLCVLKEEFKKLCYVVNVYTPCNLAGKRKLWEVLRKVKNSFGPGLWCLVGDYNSVCNSLEMRGVGRNLATQEVTEFRRFVEGMNVIDLPLLGRRFTWYIEDGMTMSRLDRFLLSQDWIDAWEVEAQCA